MTERRQYPRVRMPRGRVWLGGKRACWAELLDASPGGLRVSVPCLLEVGEEVEVSRPTRGELGTPQRATVRHVSGMSAGLDLHPAEVTEASGAVKRAWVLRGPLAWPAQVLHLDATTACIRCPGVLAPGTPVDLELEAADRSVVVRGALVVRGGEGEDTLVSFLVLPC